MYLNTRLQILKDAGQISQENYNAMLKIIRMFDRKWGIKLTEENGAMFITHFTVAFERIARAEELESMNADTLKEIRENRNYSSAREMLKEIEKEINIRIPENEENFLMIYLCILCEDIGK